MFKMVPLRCMYCGTKFVGPASMIGSGCPNNRLTAKPDLFQDFDTTPDRETR